MVFGVTELCEGQKKKIKKITHEDSKPLGGYRGGTGGPPLMTNHFYQIGLERLQRGTARERAGKVSLGKRMEHPSTGSKMG